MPLLTGFAMGPDPITKSSLPVERQHVEEGLLGAPHD